MLFSSLDEANMLRGPALVCLVFVAALSAARSEVFDGVALVPELPILQQVRCPLNDDPNHNVMLPYPNDCRKYFACFRGQAIEKQCPANLFWSQMTYRCDYREYASCKNDDFPDQSPVQFAPFPGDCRRYYEISVHICPENSHWSPTYQRCVDAQIAGCEVAPVTIPPWEPYPSYPSNPIPPTIVPTAATPPSMIETPIENAPLPIDPNMLCKSSGSKDFIPYPVDCHKFIHCGPISTILTCSGNLYWSPITLKCGISSSDCQNYH